MYVTDDKLRAVLAMLAEAGGTVAVTCTEAKTDPTATTVVRFGGTPKPSGWELHQLCKSLVSRGLASGSGMSRETGTETFSLTGEGWHVHEGAPMPLAPGAVTASAGGVQPWSPFEGAAEA